MKINLKYLKALSAHIAAKKDIRYYLCGVSIEVLNGTVFYCATDGHKLVAVKHPVQSDDEPGNMQGNQFIIPNDVIKNIKLQKLGREIIEFCNIEYDGQKLAITYCGAEYKFLPIDGKFPDWRRVIPLNFSGEIAQFNPDYLIAIRDCADDTIGIHGNTSLLLRHNGNSGAVYQTNNYDFIGVVMPVRTYDADGAYIPKETEFKINWCGIAAEKAAA